MASKTWLAVALWSALGGGVSLWVADRALAQEAAPAEAPPAEASPADAAPEEPAAAPAGTAEAAEPAPEEPAAAAPAPGAAEAPAGPGAGPTVEPTGEPVATEAAQPAPAPPGPEPGAAQPTEEPVGAPAEEPGAAEAAQPAPGPPGPEPGAAEPAEEPVGAPAGEPVAAEAGEGGVPPEGAPQGPKRRTQLFEYIESLEVAGPDAKIVVRSNVLVMVTTESDTVTVEVRRDPSRAKSEETDPPPGFISLEKSDGGSEQWEIPPQTAVFGFTPHGKTAVSVTGPSREAADEAIGILSQGPCASTSEENETEDYHILVKSDGSSLRLLGRQVTGELWVDWRLTGAGTFEVGAGGWEMPMQFVLPTGPASGKDKASLSAEAVMRYSSARAGPEEETRLTTTLALTGKNDGYRYVRSATLRPVSVPLGEESGNASKAPKLVTRKALAGGASAWARTATLATLGVQRLAGVRETGLAMWLAQTSIDSAAGRRVPRAADSLQRRALKTLATKSPLLTPPEGLVRGELFSETWLIRFEAGQSVVNTHSVSEGAMGLPEYDSSNLIVVPNISLSVRRKLKERWRVGGGLDAILSRVDTGNPRISWSSVGVSGRAEYLAETWNVGLLAGMAFTRYDMDSSSRTARGDLRSPLLGLELEKFVTKRLAAALRMIVAGDFRTTGTEGFDSMFAQPSLRWYFARNAALQVHLAWSYLVDSQAIGGDVQSLGIGSGVGVTMRW